jgi:hypothetical protein
MGIRCEYHTYDKLSPELQARFLTEHTGGNDLYMFLVHDADDQAMIVPVIDHHVYVNEMHDITVQCYLWGHADGKAGQEE